MNESVKYFLPSLIRGVYRFDERLSRIKTDEEARNFLETKLRFIPEQYTNIVRKVIDLEAINFPNAIENKLISFNSPQFNTQNKHRYQQYFSSYDYFSNQVEPNEGELNYLEAEFVRIIISPILSTEGLLQFKPQTPISSYITDFTLEASKKYVFEVDGFGKFATRDSLNRFLERQNILIQNGWTVLRYSYSDIMENTERTRKQIHSILQSDDQIRPFLLKHEPHQRHQINFGIFENIPTTDAKKSEIDILDFVNNFFLVQDLCVNQFIIKQCGEDTPVFIEDCLPYPFPLVALALTDLYLFLRDIERLFAVDFELPAITLIYQYFDPYFISLLHPAIKVQSQKDQASDTIKVTPETLLTSPSPSSTPPLVHCDINT